VKDAVEKNLIIGEAVNTLLKNYPEMEISNSGRIVNARNKLTHGYDEIENMQVWNILVNHIPVLEKEVNILLNQ
jgi:uncharacterized protein with HEPN domain